VLVINASALITPYPICHAVPYRGDVVVVVVIGIADTRRQITEGTIAVYGTLRIVWVGRSHLALVGGC
jgi:hypothetical protein